MVVQSRETPIVAHWQHQPVHAAEYRTVLHRDNGVAYAAGCWIARVKPVNVASVGLIAVRAEVAAGRGEQGWTKGIVQFAEDNRHVGSGRIKPPILATMSASG
jgi:hypothetical protein